MIILINGASHTGKTALAQRFMERLNYPYVSIDHIKMGLIRAGYTNLTPEDDPELTVYLWPVIREMAKTAIENNQNLIIEGSYIPGNWKDDFTDEHLAHIQYLCLVMTENYIREHFADIKAYENVIEHRGEDDFTADWLISDNARYLEESQKYGNPYILIENSYDLDIEDLCNRIKEQCRLMNNANQHTRAFLTPTDDFSCKRG